MRALPNRRLLTFLQPGDQLGESLIASEVDGSLSVFVADVDCNALVDEPLRKLELPLNAGKMQRLVTKRIACVQLCALG